MAKNPAGIQAKQFIEKVKTYRYALEHFDIKQRDYYMNMKHV